jgi:hypothetical protein
MVSNSILATIDRRHHNADHLSFDSGYSGTAVHNRAIQIDMRAKCFRVKAVYLQDIIDQVVFAIPLFFIQLAKQAGSRRFVNGFDPRHRGRFNGLIFSLHTTDGSWLAQVVLGLRLSADHRRWHAS